MNNIVVPPPNAIELLRVAFGAEKFCYILVAELKDPPATLSNGNQLDNSGIYLFMYWQECVIL